MSVSLWKLFCSSKGAQGLPESTPETPWEAPACSAVPQMVPAVWILRLNQKFGKERGWSLFQFFSPFHRGNFYLSPLKIFILYLKHTRLQADAFGFFLSLEASAVAHWHQQNPCHNRQTCFTKHRANARMNQQVVPTITELAQKDPRRGFLKQKARLEAFTSFLIFKVLQSEKVPVEIKELRYNYPWGLRTLAEIPFQSAV